MANVSVRVTGAGPSVGPTAVDVAVVIVWLAKGRPLPLMPVRLRGLRMGGEAEEEEEKEEKEETEEEAEEEEKQ